MTLLSFLALIVLSSSGSTFCFTTHIAVINDFPAANGPFNFSDIEFEPVVSKR